MNILSKQVEVFPVAKPRHRDSGQTNGGRLFTEYYVANIIRQLIATDGFLIKVSTSASTAKGGDSFAVTNNTAIDIEFNLDGYYFKLKGINPRPLFTDYHKVLKDQKYYIVAILEEYDTDSCELKGQDSADESGDNRYTGLKLEIRCTDKNCIDDVEKITTKHLILFDIDSSDEHLDNGKFNPDNISIIVHKDSYQKFSTESMHINGIDGKYA